VIRLALFLTKKLKNPLKNNNKKKKKKKKKIKNKNKKKLIKNGCGLCKLVQFASVPRIIYGGGVAINGCAPIYGLPRSRHLKLNRPQQKKH